MSAAAARVAWAEAAMPLLAAAAREVTAGGVLRGRRIGVCLHVEPKTAVLVRALRAAGAEVVLTGSPGTTQDDVADLLREAGLAVHGRHADGDAEHRANVARVLAADPDLLLDNGADLLVAMLARPGHRVRGATEETTSGALRLAALPPGTLGIPVVVINDSPLKQVAENEHGVGPTVVEAVMRATNLMLGGSTAVVHGFGSVGRGIARTLAALHCRVTVVEPDPVRALEAVLGGLVVADPARSPALGRLHVTATGRPGVLGPALLDRLPDEAVLANAGHVGDEIDLGHLAGAAGAVDELPGGTRRYRLRDGRTVTVLAGGAMANLAAGGGNPVETMDLGLTLQLRSLARLADRAGDLPPGPQPVPADIDRAVAEAMVRRLSPARVPPGG